MKKFLLITGIVLVVIFGVLISAPFLFKDKIQQAVLEQANKSLNAKVGFSDVNLSFIRNFPNASIQLENFYIVGVGEFSKDTLVSVKEAAVVVDLKSLFSDEGYKVNKILLQSPSVYAHVLENGKVNWDITKPDSVATPEDTTSSPFKLSLKKLIIENGKIKYKDDKSKIMFSLENLNHTLSGDMTAETTTLETSTTAGEITLEMDNIAYLKKMSALLDVEINADLKNMIFTLSKNNSKINAIDFQLNGWLKVLDNGFDMDIKLNTPGTDFKQILSLIPAIYAKDFEDIQTKGKVKLDAYVKGLYIDSIYPSFNVNMLVSEAWFKYPALPKSVDKINIDATISNPGGSLDATKVDVKKFAFVLGGNPFQGNLKLATPMSDPNIDLFVKGVLNLGMIKEVYPLDSMELSGVVDADLKLKGKMSYYDKGQYDKFFFDGKLNLANMVLKTTSLPHDLEIKKASLVFNPKFVSLPTLQMKIGKSDLNGSGKLENFIPYFLKDETLKGTLTTNSEYLNLDDLMSSSASEQTTATDTAAMTIIEIPSNLNFTLNSSFKKIVYDKIEINNAKGILQMADSKLTFKNISLSAMGGSMLMNGIYSTQNKKSPDVDMDLKINNVIFTEVFKQVETVQKLVPMFEKASGRFSTTMEMKTKLGNDMMPVINTLFAKGVLSTEDVAIKNVKTFNVLGTVLNRDELKNPELNKMTIPYEIKDGRVYTSPFDVTCGATKINVGKGSTGIDQTIDYTMKLDMPTPETTIIKMSKVGLRVGGTFSNPKVKIETKEMLQDAAATIKSQAKVKVEEAKVVAKEQVNEMKQQVKEELAPEVKKAGENIKEGGKELIRGIFNK